MARWVALRFAVEHLAAGAAGFMVTGFEGLAVNTDEELLMFVVNLSVPQRGRRKAGTAGSRRAWRSSAVGSVGGRPTGAMPPQGCRNARYRGGQQPAADRERQPHPPSVNASNVHITENARGRAHPASRSW